jgi:hypothetical protein
MLKMSQSAGSGTGFSVSSSEAQVSKCRIQAEDGQAGQYAARCAGRPPYYDPTGGSRGKQRGTGVGREGHTSTSGTGHWWWHPSGRRPLCDWPRSLGA